MAYYNCLLFDVDDTLLDFAASEQSALLETFQEFDIPCDAETISLYKEINTALWSSLEKGEIKKEKLVQKRFSLLLEKLDKKGNAAKINDFYLNKLSQKAIMYEGAATILKELAEVATIAVVSNGVEKVQKGRLEQSGLLNYIDAVFVSEKVGVEKPTREFFDTALNTLGVYNR